MKTEAGRRPGGVGAEPPRENIDFIEVLFVLADVQDKGSVVEETPVEQDIVKAHRPAAQEDMGDSRPDGAVDPERSDRESSRIHPGRSGQRLED